MAEEKGIMNKEQAKEIIDLLVEKLSIKGWPKTVLNLLGGTALELIDNNIFDRLPAKLKQPISSMLEAALKEDIDTAEEMAAEIIDELADGLGIPDEFDEAEKLIIEGLIKIIVALVKSKIGG